MKNNDINAIMQQLQELIARAGYNKSNLLEEVFLNSDQMERLLKCSPATLYRWRNKGIIPCCKVGGVYRYPKSFLTQEFLNSITKNEDRSKRFDD
ncbi:helix-turn-helix domain-containing protein [Flavobacterium sp. N1994]|uniref:helix-turn-helix domain-containing protein n=1 Tax=Flavobacterium sp. N1994 TaxID=2986827 RepID=UPI00222277C1|nr:helix-turn-helix domain-containing protein [Flavobacterium sp. N1994]